MDMLTKNLPITRETKKLRDTVIWLTADFPKRFKYTIGERLVNTSLELNKYIRRANEETNPQTRLYYIKELRFLVEDLEDLTDCCLEHKIISVRQVDRDWWRYCYIGGHHEKVMLRYIYKRERRTQVINELYC